MKAYLSRLIFCILIVVPFSLRAEDLFEVEHLWVTQTVHVPGDTLCQDGQFLYFKNQDVCTEFFTQSRCEVLSQALSPITFIEKVDLPSGDSVSHFFSIKPRYDLLRYELVADGPIKNYELVEAKQVELPLCDNKNWKPQKKIRRVRQARRSEESFLQGLVDSGVSIVNSPYGKFDPSSLLFNNANVQDPRRPHLKSPLCNAKLDYKDLVTQASGEWSGNGVVQVESLNQWHKDSLDLYINKTQSESGKEKFEFFCLNEVEDV